MTKAESNGSRFTYRLNETSLSISLSLSFFLCLFVVHTFYSLSLSNRNGIKKNGLQHKTRFRVSSRFELFVILNLWIRHWINIYSKTLLNRDCISIKVLKRSVQPTIQDNISQSTGSVKIFNGPRDMIVATLRQTEKCGLICKRFRERSNRMYFEFMGISQ